MRRSRLSTQAAALSGLPILVTHRADRSGTTAILSSYLSAVSPEWRAKVGVGTKVPWPAGVGVRGSDGVLGQVQILEGAIGYAEFSYLTGTKLSAALVANEAGAFAAPSPAGATACAVAVANRLPVDLRLMIAGCGGADPTVYPISGFSWVVVRADQTNAAGGRDLVALLNWLIHDGQRLGAGIGYAPLPDAVVVKAEMRLQRVSSGGAPLLTVTSGA